jgi:hypothetical protein
VCPNCDLNAGNKDGHRKGTDVSASARENGAQLSPSVSSVRSYCGDENVPLALSQTSLWVKCGFERFGGMKKRR